jgi:hypothetical protein
MKQRFGWLALVMPLVFVASCTPVPDGGGGSGAAPVAVISPSTTSGGAPLSVTFDASGSLDPDGTIVAYNWDFGDGTTGIGPVANHTFDEGVWRTQLVVTDNSGKIGTAFVDITVTNLAPVSVFTASATTGSAPLSVTLDGSGSYDPDGTIVSHTWSFTDLPTRTGPTITQTFPPGQFVVRLTVVDAAGKANYSERLINVSGTPAAPTGLRKTGSGCCDTYGDFEWTPVPGATAYQVEMDGYFLGGCVTDHGATFEGQRSSGRVQAVGLCLGSKYDVNIRARANGVWGPWSPTINITL